MFELADETYELYSEVQELSDKYYQVLSSIPTATPETKPVIENSVANIKLPQLAFPEFNGDYISWPQLRDTFSSLICTNVILSNINKIRYLAYSLQAEAKALIDTVPVTDANFNVAWDLLCKRYNNVRL